MSSKIVALNRPNVFNTWVKMNAHDDESVDLANPSNYVEWCDFEHPSLPDIAAYIISERLYHHPEGQDVGLSLLESDYKWAGRISEVIYATLLSHTGYNEEQKAIIIIALLAQNAFRQSDTSITSESLDMMRIYAASDTPTLFEKAHALASDLPTLKGVNVGLGVLTPMARSTACLSMIAQIDKRITQQRPYSDPIKEQIFQINIREMYKTLNPADHFQNALREQIQAYYETRPSATVRSLFPKRT